MFDREKLINNTHFLGVRPTYVTVGSKMRDNRTIPFVIETGFQYK